MVVRFWNIQILDFGTSKLAPGLLRGASRAAPGLLQGRSGIAPGCSGPLWTALGSFRPLWAAGATAARWEALGFLGPLWPLQGGGFGESGVRIRARSTYTITSTTEFHELPSNGLWPQL